MNFFFFIIILLYTTIISLSAQDILGTWNGVLNVGGTKLPLVLHVEGGKEGLTATMDSPAQGAKNIPVTRVSFVDNELALSIDNLRASYKGQLVGDSIVGIFTQGQNFPLVLRKGIVELKRPQEPKPPYLYNSEDVTFYNKDASINLAGTFTYPTEGDNFPVTILISGSGAQNRDEELMGHKPFLVISDYLTNHGIAVLRFDDRGAGKSEGDFSKATTSDFATDVYAAVEYVKSRKEVSAQKIGLLGHSEGGTIAFMVAGRYVDDILFVVSLAGTGVNGKEILKLQSKDGLIAEGVPEDLAMENQELSMKIVEVVLNNTEDDLKKNIKEIVSDILPKEKQTDQMVNNLKNSIAQMSSPWFREFIQHNPQDDLKRVKAHVFAINGDKDCQVNADVNLNGIETNLVNVKSKKTKKYEGLNHLFQTSKTGAISEYAKIEETISPVVLKDILDWIKEVTK